MKKGFAEIPTFHEMIAFKKSCNGHLAIEKAAKWKRFGEEGQIARDSGAPPTYLSIHRDPDTTGGYDPSKFNPPEHLQAGMGKPQGILYASKYYPDANGGHASDWDRYVGGSMPGWRNSRGFTFQLTPDSRIHIINNDDDYLKFHDRYHNDDMDIDWNKVRKDYDAVRFGDMFATSSGRRGYIDSKNGKVSTPYIDAGQILVFNPKSVMNAKEWRRNEDLHPGDWYPEWQKGEDLEFEKEWRKMNGTLRNNEYRGPEQSSVDSERLDSNGGYYEVPGVADFFSEKPNKRE